MQENVAVAVALCQLPAGNPQLDGAFDLPVVLHHLPQPAPVVLSSLPSSGDSCVRYTPVKGFCYLLTVAVVVVVVLTVDCVVVIF